MHINRIGAIALTAALGSAALAGVIVSRAAAQGPAAATAPSAETQRVVDAAKAFIATLSPEERQKALLPFTPLKTASGVDFGGRPGGGGPGPGGRGGPPPGAPPGGGAGGGPGGGFAGEKYGAAVWSNFPMGMIARPGAQLDALSPAQRAAALHLMQVLLSPRGYQKVQDIMGADKTLADQGQGFGTGFGVYSLAILGAPSATTPWMVEFGGHHLGLNVVIIGDHGVMTPTLTGTQPAVYTTGGKTVRVLAGESDKAFALLDALDAGQRKQAILNYRVGDLVLGPGHDGQAIVPEGLKASAMTAAQKAILLDLIAEWAGIVDNAYAGPRMADIKAGLDDTWFAWSGPTTHAPGKNGEAYYRIQGPKLVIEFSPQGLGGDLAEHVHTIYRDPTNEYGSAYTRP